MERNAQVMVADSPLFDKEAREYAANILERLADGSTVTLGDFTGGDFTTPSNAEIVAEVFREIADLMRT